MVQTKQIKNRFGKFRGDLLLTVISSFELYFLVIIIHLVKEYTCSKYCIWTFVLIQHVFKLH